MPLSDEDRENLVAYLDGELDDATAQSLTARLNTDPNLRAEADALKQAWELLDYLPRPQPTAGFTHRTLDRLTVHGLRSTIRVPRPRARLGWATGLAWAAGLL